MTDRIPSTGSPLYRGISPLTGEVLSEFPHATDEEVRNALDAADAAAGPWGTAGVAERARIVGRVADLFTEKADELGRIITREMGKAIGEAHGEAEFSGEIFRYYADNAEDLLRDVVLDDSEDSRTVVQHRPLGALLGIMPWNYPYYQVARFIAPNLVLGNTILLKHAECVPESALAIQQILDEAGVPCGVYRNLFATHDQVAGLIEDPRIHGVSLTGSEKAGAAIGEQAGRNLKKSVLEFGGSGPYVVLSSLDVGAAAREAVRTRLENAGQACNSNKRIIVHRDIYEEFLDESVAQIRSLTPGDPAIDQPATFGPMSSEAAADGLVDQVRRAVQAGATVHVGGERVGGDVASGFFVSPAVLTDLPTDSGIYREEFFGPVVQIFTVDSDEEALELANNSPYGLGSTVYAVEPGRAEAFAEGLQVGMTGVNQAAPETADMPFGGVKRSGFGRELGPLGMDEFVNERLLSVRK